MVDQRRLHDHLLLLSVCFSNTGHYVTLLAQALVSRYMLTKSGS
eukprot:SAG11_NODE_19358_length_468_cov_1.355014_1_plen_43_part_01